MRTMFAVAALAQACGRQGGSWVPDFARGGRKLNGYTCRSNAGAPPPARLTEVR